MTRDEMRAAAAEHAQRAHELGHVPIEHREHDQMATEAITSIALSLASNYAPYMAHEVIDPVTGEAAF